MRSKDDDVPIIGDYSEAQDTRLRPEAPKAPSPSQAPSPTHAPRSAGRPRDERLVLDPSDVRRHAQLARQRERAGPLAKVLRYAPIALAVVLAFIVYWNFETLRGITVDFSALTSLFADDGPARGDDAARLPGELETEAVEAPAVVGRETSTVSVDLPPAQDASVDALPATRQAAAAPEPPPEQNAPASAVVPDPVAPAEALASARESPPAPPPEPETPPAPETFAFGVPVNSVSEGDAAAAVLILRNGGNRGISSVTWWTSDGSATAGVDYADLGTVVEKFAAGRQNLTIRIPIVGDRMAEGPETFYVHLATSEGALVSDERAGTEVVINDDD